MSVQTSITIKTRLSVAAFLCFSLRAFVLAGPVGPAQNAILNTTTLQPGAVFYVSSGTAANLTASTITVRAIQWPNGTQTGVPTAGSAITQITAGGGLQGGGTSGNVTLSLSTSSASYIQNAATPQTATANISSETVRTSLNLPYASGVLKSTAGSVTGSATTSDLPEGSRQYFTVGRATAAISANSPLSISGGSLSISSASASSSGYLKSTDWSAFDGKEDSLTFSAPLQESGGIVSLNSSSVTLQSNTFNVANRLLKLSSGGLVPNALIDGSSVTKMGNSFNASGQLVQLTGFGLLPILNGSNLTNLTSANLTGLVPNSLIDSSSVTKQGNTFNVANRLVLLTGAGALPALSAVNLTSIPSANLSGTVPNALLDSSSVTKQGNTFNGLSQLVKTASTGLISNSLIDGSSVTKAGNSFNGASQILQLSASALVPNSLIDTSSVTKMGNTFGGANQLLKLNSSALIDNASVDTSSVTKAGNTFNAASKLLQLDSSSRYPAFDGSLITGIGGFARLNSTQTWTAAQTFTSSTTFTGGYFRASSGTITNLTSSTATLHAIQWADGTVQVSSPAASGFSVRGAGIGGSGNTITAGITTASYTASSGSPYAADASTTTTVLVTVDANLTMNGPTNGVDGQKITFRLKNDASHAVTFATGSGNFAFGSTFSSYAVSASSTDYVGAIYYSSGNRWHIVSESLGF